MKHYDYSVKNVLTEYFGNNTIFEMRKPHKDSFESEQHGNIIPLLWQYADKRAVEGYTDEYFLLDTSFTDDYMVYTVQRGEKKLVILMFMLIEGEEPYIYDCYAKKLLHEWNDKGFESKILLVHIYVDNNKETGRFHFGTHVSDDAGETHYELKKINGEETLVFEQHPFWAQLHKKAALVSLKTDIREWECIFEPDVKIVRCKGKSRNSDEDIICSGLKAVYDYLTNKTVDAGYEEYKDIKLYACNMFINGKSVDVTVSGRNLICKISFPFEENRYYDRKIEFVFPYDSLLENIPELKSVRALDVEQMYAYAIELCYSDGTMRYYYMKCFEENEIPDFCEIDGYKFTADILASAMLFPDGYVQFANGYSIKKHILYYRSYRQHIYETANTSYHDEKLSIIPKFIEPLERDFGLFCINRYVGFDNEIVGANKGFVNSDGQRITDIALYRLNSFFVQKGVYNAYVSPVGKYGVLKSDGSWLLPPIYDEIIENDNNISAIRTVNGKEERIFVTDEGKIFDFPYSYDAEEYAYGIIRFNAEKWEGERPYAGFYDDDGFFELEAGKWGFMDEKGNILVEPKYVYAMGFWQTNGKISIVARYVNGELLWGAIDRSGKEIVACIYAGTYTFSRFGIGFQREVGGLYGLIDFDGNIIVEPMFDYIREYNPERRLITTGEDEDTLGVYSVDFGKWLIPVEYDYIEYGERIITCQPSFEYYHRYFDYEGNEMFFKDYDSISEKDGMLEVYKDGKYGYIDYDGIVIIPPVLVYGKHFEVKNYNRGFLKTEKHKLYGVSKTDGTVIIPEKYSKIEIYEHFLLASNRTDTNSSFNDTLFTLDGRPILQGAFRNIRVNEKTHTITVDTPQGTEHLEYKVNDYL